MTTNDRRLGAEIIGAKGKTKSAAIKEAEGVREQSNPPDWWSKPIEPN